MKINEEKEFGIYKVERQGTNQCRKIYSDHNAIMLNIDFTSKMEEKRQEKNHYKKRLSEVQEIHKTKTNK